MTARALVTLSLVCLSGAIAYLRDPPWLIRMESGFRPWERAADGTPVRWTGGHASFFVSAAATRVRMPVRTTFAASSDSPVEVTFSIDDRAAERVVLQDDAWRAVTLVVPPGGGRRVRRIDVRVDRTRAGNRGVQIGRVESQ